MVHTIAGFWVLIAAQWTDVSKPLLDRLEKEGAKIAWPGATAGVAVDPMSGDVFMVVPGQGLWRSTDQGLTFARVDGGAISGRCETAFSLQVDPAGRRPVGASLEPLCL